jgi:hypothetical protein
MVFFVQAGFIARRWLFIGRGLQKSNAKSHLSSDSFPLGHPSATRKT